MGTNSLQTPVSLGAPAGYGAGSLEQGSWAVGVVTGPQAAPVGGTAVPAAVRLRPSTTGVPMTGFPVTGLPIGAGTTELRTTPGEPPPRALPSD